MSSETSRGLIESLFSFKGRSSRLAFWLCFFLITPFLLVLNIAIDLATKHNDESGVVVLILLLLFSPFLWIQVAVSSRRCHDLGRSGWFFLVSFIPFAGPIGFLVYAGFFRGTAGENRFGADLLS